MLRAIRLINEAKTAQSSNSEGLTVDLHPSRPEYRGIMAAQPISLEADPTFDEIEAAGATVAKNAEPHTILDDMFLVSGMIPRITPYEKGVIKGIRFYHSSNSWEKDELICDERLVMCNLKGMITVSHVTDPEWPRLTSSNRQRDRHLHRLQSRWRGQRLQARCRIGRRLNPPICCSGRVPSRRPIQRAASSRNSPGFKEIGSKGITCRTLFGVAGQVRDREGDARAFGSIDCGDTLHVMIVWVMLSC
jgi:hypothetical protein